MPVSLGHICLLVSSQVSKPIIENIQNALRIEGTDISITLSARWIIESSFDWFSEFFFLNFVYAYAFCSSFIEREDWFYTISRTVSEHAQSSAAFSTCPREVGLIPPLC